MAIPIVPARIRQHPGKGGQEIWPLDVNVVGSVFQLLDV